jgi:hypothetical protein
MELWGGLRVMRGSPFFFVVNLRPSNVRKVYGCNNTRKWHDHHRI